MNSLLLDVYILALSPYGLVGVYQRYEQTSCISIHPEDEGSVFLPDYTA